MLILFVRGIAEVFYQLRPLRFCFHTLFSSRVQTVLYHFLYLFVKALLTIMLLYYVLE